MTVLILLSPLVCRIAGISFDTVIATGPTTIGLVVIAIILFQWYKLRQWSKLFLHYSRNQDIYRLVAESTKNVVFITDASGQISYVNPSIQQLLGYTPQEFLKLTPEHILASESCQRFINAICGQQNTIAEQFKMRHRNGKEIWGILSSRVVQDETTGKFKGTVNVLQDISEHKQAKRQSHKRERQYRLIFEQSANSIVELDSQGLIVDCNNRIEQCLGYRREEIIGKPLTMFLYQHANEVKKLVGLAGGTSSSGEYKMVRKDGNIIVVKINASAFSLDDFHNTICLIDDITLKRKQEKERLMLEKLESMQTFVSGMAHDFNNILAGILGNIELAQLQLIDGEKAYKKLDAAKEACTRANDLTWQFLTLFSDEKPDKIGAIDWIIKESIKATSTGKESIQCRSYIDSDLAPLCYNAFQLKKALDHLLINAVEAMPDGGCITVRAQNIGKHNIPEESNGWTTPKECVQISIEDHGIGISPSDLPKIFDPYFSRKRIGGRTGVGMGLAMVYSIIKRHHGYVDVTSTPGKGTIFFVYLPAAATSPDNQSLKAISGHGKVLVMDDEQIVREVAAEMLRCLGYEVDLAEDATEAIDLYQTTLNKGERYVAIILDLTIAGSMKGDEVLARIKLVDSEVKAIVSTGYSNADVLQNYQKYGFCAAMPKPYKLNNLAKILHEII